MRSLIIRSLTNSLIPALVRAVEGNHASLGMLRWLATEEGRTKLHEHLSDLERHWRGLQPNAARRTLTVKQADAAWGALKEALTDLGVPSNGDALHPRNADDPQGFRRHMVAYWTGASNDARGFTVSGDRIDKVFPHLPSDRDPVFYGHYVGIRHPDGRFHPEDRAPMGIIQLRIEEALEELAKRETNGG